ncbi:MAG: hypothetical protein JSS10_03830 [Verrucomicrobia bacterium]|nr:hypothetical protein [Verrucomicrobiota bacterium]
MESLLNNFSLDVIKMDMRSVFKTIMLGSSSIRQQKQNSCAILTFLEFQAVLSKQEAIVEIIQDELSQFQVINNAYEKKRISNGQQRWLEEQFELRRKTRDRTEIEIRCSVSDIFRSRYGDRGPIGFINSLRVNCHEFKGDFNVQSPTNDSNWRAVGILSNFFLDLSHFRCILSMHVSDLNRPTLLDAIHEKQFAQIASYFLMDDVPCEFSLTIFDHDLEKCSYYQRVNCYRVKGYIKSIDVGDREIVGNIDAYPCSLYLSLAIPDER